MPPQNTPFSFTLVKGPQPVGLTSDETTSTAHETASDQTAMQNTLGITLGNNLVPGFTGRSAFNGTTSVVNPPAGQVGWPRLLPSPPDEHSEVETGTKPADATNGEGSHDKAREGEIVDAMQVATLQQASSHSSHSLLAVETSSLSNPVITQDADTAPPCWAIRVRLPPKPPTPPRVAEVHESARSPDLVIDESQTAIQDLHPLPPRPRSPPRGAISRKRARSPEAVDEGAQGRLTKRARFGDQVVTRLNNRLQQLGLVMQVSCTGQLGAYSATIAIERFSRPVNEVIFSSKTQGLYQTRLLAREDVANAAMRFLAGKDASAFLPVSKQVAPSKPGSGDVEMAEAQDETDPGQSAFKHMPSSVGADLLHLVPSVGMTHVKDVVKVEKPTVETQHAQGTTGTDLSNPIEIDSDEERENVHANKRADQDSDEDVLRQKISELSRLQYLDLTLAPSMNKMVASFLLCFQSMETGQVLFVGACGEAEDDEESARRSAAKALCEAVDSTKTHGKAVNSDKIKIFSMSPGPSVSEPSTLPRVGCGKVFESFGHGPLGLQGWRAAKSAEAAKVDAAKILEAATRDQGTQYSPKSSQGVPGTSEVVPCLEAGKTVGQPKTDTTKKSVAVAAGTESQGGLMSARSAVQSSKPAPPAIATQAPVKPEMKQIVKVQNARLTASQKHEKILGIMRKRSLKSTAIMAEVAQVLGLAASMRNRLDGNRKLTYWVEFFGEGANWFDRRLKGKKICETTGVEATREATKQACARGTCQMMRDLAFAEMRRTWSTGGSDKVYGV